jgi:hypothetical protein
MIMANHEDGIVQSAMTHLFNIVSGVKNLGPSANHPFLPSGFGGGTPNMKLLRVVVWLLDGLRLKLSDTGSRISRARDYIVNTLQPHCSIGSTGTEIFSASHTQLYYGGFGALLWSLTQEYGKLIPSDLVTAIKNFWQIEMWACRLCRLPDNSGAYLPGARAWIKGKKIDPPLASNRARDLAYRIVVSGAHTSHKLHDLKDKYNLGAICLNHYMDEVPGNDIEFLVSSNVIKLPSNFHVRRSGNEFAAWFDGLKALQPCLAVGYSEKSGLWTSEKVPDQILNGLDFDGNAWPSNTTVIDVEGV